MSKILTFEEFNQVSKVEEAKMIDITHMTLDIIGLVPGWGALADLANAVLYIKHKEYLLASLCLISTIPALGDFLGKSTKISLYLSKYAKAGTTLGKIFDVAKMSAAHIKKLKTAISAYYALTDRLFEEIEKSEDKQTDQIKPHVPKLRAALKEFVGR